MEFHEFSNLFPLMGDKEYQELLEDIKKNGLIEPITLYKGQILDGRNRYKACKELGIEPKYNKYNGDDPFGFVLSLNLHRRHLTSAQRAELGLKLLEVEKEKARERQEVTKLAGKDERGNPIFKNSVRPSEGTTDDEVGKALELAAKKVRVSHNTLSKAKKIKETADQDEEIANAWEQAKAGKKSVNEVFKQVKKRNHQEKIEAQKKTKISNEPQKYKILYADPPWCYNDKQDTSILGGAIKHYSTMSIQELCALPVRDIATENSVLFLWVTSPLLAECWPVIDAWDFKYKASFIWDKVKHNMGHYNSVRHEFLLICTRGSCTPQNIKLFDSVQSIEKTDIHSQKPEKFREIIDTLYPDGKRIELFARGTIPQKWDAWGNEAK